MIARIRSALIDHGLVERAGDILALARDGVRLEAHPVDGDLATDASKLGGEPDVSADFVWPTWKNAQLAFLTQLNLAELRAFPECGILPPAGLLQFFYDAEQRTWGIDPKDRGSFLVRWEQNIDGLHRARGGAANPACRVQMRSESTIPAFESSDYALLALSPAEGDAYRSLWEVLGLEPTDGGTAHQVLGHAIPVQGDMQVECQLVTNGLYCGDPSGYGDPRAAALRPGARDWRLLFQLDSDEGAGLMWGDVGRLYFWMREQDLSDGRFDRAWMQLQCA